MSRFEFWVFAYSLVFAIAIATPATSFSGDPELVAAWLFDEGKGDVARDATGNGHDGKIVGAKWAVGKRGGGIKFDGSGALVKVPDADGLALKVFTVGAWVNVPGPFGWQTVLARDFIGEGIVSRNYGMFIVPESRDVHFSFSNAAGQHFGPNGEKVAADGAWHHVAMSYDGKTLRGYVDGQLDLEQDLLGPPFTNQRPAPLFIGGETGRAFLKGTLDEPFIARRALSQQDIKKLMAGIRAVLADQPSKKPPSGGGKK